MEDWRASAGPSVFMAVVAGGGAIDEIGDTCVLVRGRYLLMSGRGMAVDAGEGGIVRGDLVAIVADRVVMRNRKISVLESRVEPAYRRVATITGRRKARGDVIRDEPAESLRAVPIGLMAAIAGGVCGR
jgi:hypothetical protein